MIKPRSITKAKKTTAFAKGQTVTMLFHYAGLVSEEQYEIAKVDKHIVTLDTDEDKAKRFRFDAKTGACLNDNTTFGACRTLKL